VSWIWNIKLRLLIGGSVLIVLGLILYLVKGVTAVLVLPVVGVVLLIVGVLYKPRKKKIENTTNTLP
jgi:Flp pilus assembly protein TadB